MAYLDIKYKDYGFRRSKDTKEYSKRKNEAIWND